MEENKNDIDDLVENIDSLYREMSIKDIVATHDGFFDDDSLMEGQQDDDERTQKQQKENKPQRIKIDNTANKTNSKYAKVSEQKKYKQNHKSENVLTKNEDKDNKEGQQKINLEEKEGNEIKKENDREEKIKKAGSVGSWFQTCCYINIPIVGFIYVLVLAFRKNTPEEKKYFAKGYLLYKVMVWLLAIVLLYCLYKLGLDFIDGMLSFIKG